MIIEGSLAALSVYGIYKLVNKKKEINVPQITEDIEEEKVLIAKDRPQGWNEFIGNKNVVESLMVSCKYAAKTDTTLGNILLLGPAGTGKTTLARIIAKETGYHLIDMNGTTMSNMTDIYNTVKKLSSWIEDRKEKAILFIDEIHALDGNTATVRETLKPLIEESIFKTNLCYVDGKMKRCRPWSHKLPAFTVIGATDQDIQDKAIRSRFRILSLASYMPEEIELIIMNYCKKTGRKFDGDSIKLIAERSRLNPRLAIHNLKEIWEYAFVADMDCASFDLARTVLQEKKGIYQYGLTAYDINYLQKLRSSERPIGYATLRKTLRIPEVTFQEIEELLFDLNFVEATPRGRKITEEGIEWLVKEEL